jgi:type IV secretion system protein VirB9
MRHLPLLMSACLCAGCAHAATPLASSGAATIDAPRADAKAPSPPETRYIGIPEPLPLPGQLKPLPPQDKAPSVQTDTRLAVDAANARARVAPSRAGWVNAVQIYPFADGALYQVYAAPGQVTDIALEPGEQLVGTGPVAAGDTVRWVIGDTTSGTGPTARVHILLKPTRADLQTNLVINTDRRTYHIELHAAERTYMASVSWTYPADQLIALKRQADAAPPAPVATSQASVLDQLNFAYQIKGDHPAWRPIRAFDDGRQVMVEFPETIAQREMPPIWVLGPKGEAQLVNYRVHGRFMVVDRLFEAAELRLGGKHQQKVRIVREGGSGA